MSKLVNVKAYLPWMRRVCSRRLVLDQLDNLEHDLLDDNVTFSTAGLEECIAQIKKDVARIQS